MSATAAATTTTAPPVVPVNVPTRDSIDIEVSEKTPLLLEAADERDPAPRDRPVVEIVFGLCMASFFLLLVVRQALVPTFDLEFKYALLGLHLISTLLAHLVLVKNCTSKLELALYLIVVDGISAPVLYWTLQNMFII